MASAGCLPKLPSSYERLRVFESLMACGRDWASEPSSRIAVTSANLLVYFGMARERAVWGQSGDGRPFELGDPRSQFL